MFVEPMYALPLPNLRKNPKAKEFILQPDLWVAEEKFDGIRLVTEISDRSDQLFIDKGITSWSRYGNIRDLPEHIKEELSRFPNCLIDGELVAPGKRSYGTMDLDNTADLEYFIFDIIRLRDQDLTSHTYYQRRTWLKNQEDLSGTYIHLAPSIEVDTWGEIFNLRDQVWARDGEGLILKRKNSLYFPGKRPKNVWIKIKKLQSDPFTVIGFESSRGEINDRGPYGMTKVVDGEGNRTQVKTKNDAQCRLFEERGKLYHEPARSDTHPDIGRILWCEYQERTPDGSYRHIRWDRWDDE